MNDDELNYLAARYAALDAERSVLDDECEDIKAKLRKALRLGTTETATGFKVRLTANRRFSGRLAEIVIPRALWPEVHSTVFDSAKARLVLPPKLYDRCMADVGELKVSITPPTSKATK